MFHGGEAGECDEFMRGSEKRGRKIIKIKLFKFNFFAYFF